MRQRKPTTAQALEITRGWYGENHPKTAAGLTLLARALVYQKRNGEADALLQEALAIRERVYGPTHPTVASTINELGNIAVGEDRYDEAIAYFSRMVEIYRSVVQREALPDRDRTVEQGERPHRRSTVRRSGAALS